MPQSAKLERLFLFNLLLNGLGCFLLLRELKRLKLMQKENISEMVSLHEDWIFQSAGNSGYSPAAATVMKLYREGKLFGEGSILSGKNMMGANWQSVILPKANLLKMDLSYVNLDGSILQQTDLTEANLSFASLKSSNLVMAKLIRANFMQANLRKADLTRVNAMGSSLFMTHAQRSILRYADFRRADFQEADLHGADVRKADLSGALMRDTNLANANLEKTNLKSVRMMRVNLKGANLTGTYFDGSTILPDAEFILDEGVYDKHWTSDTDMKRYTDSDHPDFWQPEWARKYDWVMRNYDED